jgi:DNA-directed RNA polymerase specialized sigma24 family protein
VAVQAIVVLRGQRTPRIERAWLYRVTHNEVMNLFRTRRATAPLDEALADTAAGPAEATLARESFNQLVQDVDSLGGRAQMALIMTEFEGRPRVEVAAALGLRADSVSQLLADARDALRRNRAGRALSCHIVRAILSEADRRAHRTRPVRAHLRSCAACRTLAKRAL